MILARLDRLNGMCTASPQTNNVPDTNETAQPIWPHVCARRGTALISGRASPPRSMRTRYDAKRRWRVVCSPACPVLPSRARRCPARRRTPPRVLICSAPGGTAWPSSSISLRHDGDANVLAERSRNRSAHADCCQARAQLTQRVVPMPCRSPYPSAQYGLASATETR